MASVKLNFPILIQYGGAAAGAQYLVRPLFVPHPMAMHQRHALAISQFKKEIRQFFRGFVFDGSSLEELLWFLFHPTLHYEQYEIECNIGNEPLKGRFGAVHFTLQEMVFVCLPRLNHFMFIADGELASSGRLKEQITKVVKRILTQFKDMQGADFNPNDYYSDRREFVTSIAVNIPVGTAPFKFERDNNELFFARIREMSTFDGAIEMEKVAQDLNSRYPDELQRAFFRDDFVELLYHILFVEGKTSIALVGPEGVGKHTVIHEVVWQHQHQMEALDAENAQRIWQLDPNRIISGMSYVGMWQNRFEEILQYAISPKANEKISDKILIDNPVALLRIGKSANNNMTLSDVLRPYLEKKHLQVILIATPGEWGVMQSKDRRFTDLFQVFPIYEPDYVTTVRMILQFRRRLEQQGGVSFSIQAIQQALNIQRSFLRNRPLPGSVTHLLQRLANDYRFQYIDSPEVRQAFRVSSGLREDFIDPAQVLEKEDVRNIIEAELVGQPAAVQAIVNAIHILKARLSDRTKPVASYLFVGPTGVGKTHAAKTLCRYLTGKEDALLRFDMNEYSDHEAVSRLTGDFLNPEGQLTGQVKYRPFGVLLLDEIEKAHPKVHDLLLQVLDDARLTDSLGQTIDFSNLIIILTSNVGARDAQSFISWSGQPPLRDVYRKAVEQQFRPEFVNRIDEIVVFESLTLEHIQGIAKLQIRELLQRDGFVRRTTILNITQPALDWVARRGFDASKGGRALRRQIESDLTTLSAEQLIAAPSSKPIILNILLEAEKLIPQVIELDFVEPLQNGWLPLLPEFKREKQFYSALLRRVDKILQQVKKNEGHSTSIISGDEQVDWLPFHFKNKLAETEERLKARLLGLAENLLTSPLRLKADHWSDFKSGGKGVRETFKDWLFQREALKEISENYQYGTNRFDGMNTTLIGDFLDVAFLEVASHGFFHNTIDKIKLAFKSCVTGLGDKETLFLLDKYADLFTMLDISHQVNKNLNEITAEGYGLASTFQRENGIHLFYLAHQHPLPIRATLTVLSGGIEMPVTNEIIRIYDGTKTLTDLRSGFSNAFNITPKEFQLLVYAGIVGEND